MPKVIFVLCGLVATILLVHGLPTSVDMEDAKVLDTNVNDESDLKPAETFGFGFYPGYYGGGGGGYYGRGYYGRGYYGGHGGYGGYGGWGYGGYRGYGSYYRRPIYPVWG